MEWFRLWFGPLYEELYGHRDGLEASLQVRSLLKTTGVPTLPVLDAGCGAGRHLQALRDQGCRAVGTDLSAHLLSRAIVRGPVLRSDLRRPPFRAGSFGLVAAFFSVFGYLDTPEEDLCLLDALSGLVARGGHLHLDLPDPDHVRSHLVARDERAVSGGTVVQERWIADGCVHKRITLERDGRAPEQYLERVRLWERDEVEREAGRRGLATAFLAGTSDGSPWAPGSPRQGWTWRKD